MNMNMYIQVFVHVYIYIYMYIFVYVRTCKKKRDHARSKLLSLFETVPPCGRNVVSWLPGAGLTLLLKTLLSPQNSVHFTPGAKRRKQQQPTKAGKQTLPARLPDDTATNSEYSCCV